MLFAPGGFAVTSENPFTLNEAIKNKKFGKLKNHEKSIAFKVIEEGIRSAFQELNEAYGYAKTGSSGCLFTIDKINVHLSQYKESLKAIRLNLPQLSKEQLAQEKQGLTLCDNSLQALSNAIKECTEKFFENSKEVTESQSKQRENQLKILGSYSPELKRAFTQICFIEEFKHIEIESFETSLKAIRVKGRNWSINALIQIAVIGRFIELFMNMIDKCKNLTEIETNTLLDQCRKSLVILQTASFDLNNAKELSFLKEAVERIEADLNAFSKKLTFQKDGGEGLKKLQIHLNELKVTLDTLSNSNQFEKRTKSKEAVDIFKSVEYLDLEDVLEPTKKAVAIISLFEQAIDRDEDFCSKEDNLGYSSVCHEVGSKISSKELHPDVLPAIIWAKKAIENKKTNEELTTDELNFLNLCLGGTTRIKNHLNNVT